MGQDRELRLLPLSDVVCRPQVRGTFDEADLAALTQSLREVGLLQPILVRREGAVWVVVDGERRYRAAQRAGWAAISAIEQGDDLSEGEIVHRQLVCNIQRADLSPIEIARGIEQLMKESCCTSTQAATKVSLSPASVSKLLALLTLPQEAQDLVHRGRLAASTAYEIAKTSDPDRRAELLAVATEGLLKREVASGRRPLVRRPGNDTAPRPRMRASQPRVRIPLGTGCSLTLSGGGEIAELVGALERLLGRLRAASAQPGVDLAATLKALATRGELGGGPDVRPAG